MSEERLCERCEKPIPAGRLEALPETQICVKCSEEIGGEFDMYFTEDNVSKVGSMKKNYGSLTVKKIRRHIQKKDEE